MKKLYLEQQSIPILEMTEEEQAMRDAGKWPTRYVVKKVVGSVTPKIHAHMTEIMVEELCANPDWQVEIT